MQRINYLAIFAIIAVSMHSGQAAMEGTIMEMLNEFRDRMCHPIPSLGLPALDPFQISHLEYSLDNKYVSGFSGSLTNAKLTGLSDIVVSNLKINMLPLQRSGFDVTMPLTRVTSQYTAKGWVYNLVELAGDGDAEAHVKNIRLSVSWIFKTGLTMGIRSLRMAITIDEIFVDFGKLIQEERINDFFHALINELGLELLDDVWKAEDEYIVSVVETLIDNFLGQFTLADIIKMIGGSGGDSDLWGDVPADCKTN